jgi:hypothetical protein
MNTTINLGDALPRRKRYLVRRGVHVLPGHAANSPRCPGQSLERLWHLLKLPLREHRALQGQLGWYRTLLFGFFQSSTMDLMNWLHPLNAARPRSDKNHANGTPSHWPGALLDTLGRYAAQAGGTARPVSADPQVRDADLQRASQAGSTGRLIEVEQCASRRSCQ